ncbi:phosphoribosylamine--glycine ligase [Holotrichia oblita]|nr:phosphoribosylamine--glycine ligase [Holotrichia oblita]
MMDDPLAAGIVDAFIEAGLSVFGPKKNAAIIESSKAYAKELMKKYNIPTAAYETFDDYEKALDYIKKSSHPLVIKADGLALGKGVIICNNLSESETALKEMMLKKKFGKSGGTVVIEEFLTWPEVTVLSFCDGKTVVPMVSSQDHKRAYDNDIGLNTGGMGTFSPSKYYTSEIAKECNETIFKPTIDALIKENRPFTGIIYFGLMLTENGLKVIEYNSRFGDPETQVVLPRLDTDLFTIFKACVDKTLDQIEIKWKDSAACCVVAASGGYPQSYKKGYEITGLDELESENGLYVFHAGTKLSEGKCVTDGGRVLGITGIGENLDAAIKKAYDGVAKVRFKDMHYRKDIGRK